MFGALCCRRFAVAGGLTIGLLKEALLLVLAPLPFKMGEETWLQVKGGAMGNPVVGILCEVQMDVLVRKAFELMKASSALLPEFFSFTADDSLLGGKMGVAAEFTKAFRVAQGPAPFWQLTVEEPVGAVLDVAVGVKPLQGGALMVRTGVWHKPGVPVIFLLAQGSLGACGRGGAAVLSSPKGPVALQ